MSSWSPHNYYNTGNELQFDKTYLSRLIRDGRGISSNDVPVFFTLNHFARTIDVPFTYLHQIVQRQYDPYRSFNIHKRSGGYRQISVPEAKLLLAQRWIHQNILKRVPRHRNSTAYADDCSTLKNAIAHCGTKWMVKIDIRRFFESISERQVYHVFRALGYKDLLSFELARLTTKLNKGSRKYGSKRWKSEKTYRFYNIGVIGHLPQGAPTSPMLANLVCLPLDNALSNLASKNDCSYTRYADDIVFSGISLNRDKASELIRATSIEFAKYGFKRNTRKTHIIPPGARKIVTGLNVNESSPKVPRELREQIELHLYYANKYGVSEHCVMRGFISLIGFKHHLEGLILYVEHVDKFWGDRYREQFESLIFPDLD